MSGTALSSVWQIAPAITAQVLGLPFRHFRPNGPFEVVAPWNMVGTGTIPAWITADAKLMADKPFIYGKPVGFAAVDPTKTQVGDYLVGSLTVLGPKETFFIASQDIPSPIQVVRCNKVLSFSRPGDAQPGPEFYGGDITRDEQPLVTKWPAAVIQSTHQGKDGDTKLPGDTLMPWVDIFLPATCEVRIEFNDFATEEQDDDSLQAAPMRYIVSSTELTPLGWRLTAATTVT